MDLLNSTLDPDVRVGPLVFQTNLILRSVDRQGGRGRLPIRETSSSVELRIYLDSLKYRSSCSSSRRRATSTLRGGAAAGYLWLGRMAADSAGPRSRSAGRYASRETLGCDL